MVKTFIKLEHHEQILMRPSMYIGSMDKTNINTFILNSNEELIKKDLNLSLGLYKIFDEIFTNALDQNDDVDIDIFDQSIKIKNTGSSIPIKKYDDSTLIPELIFGHLLSSSNYNEERYGAGTNGLGAKLTNIFSSKFIVKISDGEKIFSQSYSDNMKKSNDYKIIQKKQKEYVEIEFYPDFKRFYTENFSGDILDFITSRIYFVSSFYNKKITLNGKKINFTFKNSIKCESYNSLFIFSDELQQGQISFVNNNYTFAGGNHINNIINSISAETELKPNEVKNNVLIISYISVKNPEFNSQTKEFFSSNYKAKFLPSKPLIKKFKEISKQLQDAKDIKMLDKTNGKKSNKIKVKKLEDAFYAGSSKSDQCTLILTEGDSGKTFAVSSIPNREYYGIFPLKGKFLNIRDATKKQLTDNEEFNNIKKIIGLQHGKEYNDTKSLRYGKIMVLTDADSDGIHIRALLYNLFSHFWPSLLKLNFLISVKTPIVKATKGSQIKEFYDLKDFEKVKSSLKNYKIKYYKGLGTSTSKEAKECFKDPKYENYKYINDEKFSLLFDKKRADERKIWINNRKVEPDVLQTYDHFIDHKLIDFSLYDLKRSIPNMIDGLKPSQRKILYASFKKSLNSEIKVSQFSGYVSEITSYHHGENSLNEAIISMAQDYIGSNNINLLMPIGQFGTRLSGGHDHASPRYIYTQLNSITKYIFKEEDNILLNYLDDDGFKIEPEFYIPIIPMILVNGSIGIGTGFSCNIPMFCPSSITKSIKNYLKTGSLLEIKPFFKNFKGSVVLQNDKKIITQGIIKNNVITELPVGRSTNDFIEYLDNNDINYKNNSTEKEVNITITQNEFNIEKQMETSFSLNNMHLFDYKGVIKKYETPESIVEDFIKIRLDYFCKRKRAILKDLQTNLEDLNNKYIFIKLVIAGTIIINNNTREKILESILKHKLKNEEELLKIRIYEFTKEELVKLENCINDIKSKINYYNSKSDKDLWIYDLDNLEIQLEKL